VDNYTNWLQDNLFVGRTRTREGLVSGNESSITESLEASTTGLGSNEDPIAGYTIDTSCTGQQDCAVGYACVDGYCILSSTENSGDPRIGGGCGTGGTGSDNDYGCIQIGGSSGCTTATCGDLDGSPGGAEWCCGDWLCDQEDADGNVKCRCVPRDFRTCNVDSDCPEGEICSNGFCINDYRDCTEDNDCPEGYICDAGYCVIDLSPLRCDTDADCPDLYDCVDGYCAYVGFELCTVDADCSEGYICVDGFCIFDWPSAFRCEVDADCDEGYVCVDGWCLFDFPNCEDSAECGQGEVCVSGFCFPGCQTEIDCPAGLECINGYCSNSCASDDVCADGKICIGGYCFPGCRSDDDCPDGYECSGTICLPRFDVCTESYDCNPSESCLNGYCFPGYGVCNDSSDCLENEVCLNGFCVAFADIPDFGFDFDFTDCTAMAEAEVGYSYTAEATVISNCGYPFIPCLSNTPEVATGGTQVYGGYSYIKFQEDGVDVWIQKGCPGFGSGIPPLGGDLGGWGGGGWISEPEEEEDPPGPWVRCDSWCASQFEAGFSPPSCEGVPKCSECEYCSTNDNSCKRYPNASAAGAPCFCFPEESCKNRQCSKCGQRGDCVRDRENCLICCDVCTSCPDFSGDGFNDQACKFNCVPELELPVGGSPCEWPDCPDPPGDDGDCAICETTTVCGLISAGVPPCPPGYALTGTLSANGNICSFCEKCDYSNCGDDPQPAYCNCEFDCGYCQVCSSAGECEPDPACS